MLLERPPEAVGHRVESAIPGCALSVDRRIEEPPVGRQSLAERFAFDAEPAGVGGMRLVAGDRGAAGAVRRRDHPTADAAIGACRSDAAACGLGAWACAFIARCPPACPRRSP